MQSHPNRSRGMTLIELMVVVVIVAILASVAYPSYRQQVIKTNRTEAKAALMQLAGNLEKCYTRWHDYTYDAANGCQVVTDAETDNYIIQATKRTATEYTLQATPKGGQLDDKKCGALTLDQFANQGHTEDGDGKGCW